MLTLVASVRSSISQMRYKETFPNHDGLRATDTKIWALATIPD